MPGINGIAGPSGQGHVEIRGAERVQNDAQKLAEAKQKQLDKAFRRCQDLIKEVRSGALTAPWPTTLRAALGQFEEEGYDVASLRASLEAAPSQSQSLGAKIAAWFATTFGRNAAYAARSEVLAMCERGALPTGFIFEKAIKGENISFSNKRSLQRIAASLTAYHAADTLKGQQKAREKLNQECAGACQFLGDTEAGALVEQIQRVVAKMPLEEDAS